LLNADVVVELDENDDRYNDDMIRMMKMKMLSMLR